MTVKMALTGCDAMTGDSTVVVNAEALPEPSEPPSPPQAATMTYRAAKAAARLRFTETKESSFL